jgi:DNA primase
MARVANEVIERIKAEVSLVRLVEQQGYALVKQGKDLALCCPFHDDKTPSCVITPSSNLFHCFGCDAGGTVIDWVMKTQSVSFRHALELLQEMNPETSVPVVKKNRVATANLFPVGAPDAILLQEIVAFYQRALRSSPEAVAYLETRGLNDAELISHFKLGFANRTLGYQLPRLESVPGQQLRTQLKTMGILRESGHEHLNGSLVIPLFNTKKEVVQLYGRKIVGNLRVGTPDHVYLPQALAGIFNIDTLQQLAAEKTLDEIILCEALIDALTFWRFGFKNVTSSFGVNGFTEEILQTLIDLNIKRVLIAFDRDEAGDSAAEKVAKQLNEKGIDAFRILFPKGMDANEYALKVTPAEKSLELVIRKAAWLGKGAAPDITTAAPLPLAANNSAVLIEQDTVAIQESAIANNIQKKHPLGSLVSVIAPTPTAAIQLEQRDDALFVVLGDRTYRIRGLANNPSPEQLKIQLYAQRGEHFFIDRLDLYSSKQRQVFINQSSRELGVSDEILKKDLGLLLLALEQEQLRQKAQQTETGSSLSAEQSLSPEDREAALELLRDANLPQRILNDFNLAGVVGEETNKLVGYLASVSRKLDKPLAVVIQSSSAAGKSSLMDAVLSFMPEEERVQYSAMTGQSLFYMGETRLKHKILAISEEEGAHTASYALKLLQSEGEVTIASTGKDDSTGQLITREYKVEGPVMLFLTTTAIDIDEELLNRCLVLTVNESREQTQAIHQAQRLKRTLQGLESKIKKEKVLQLHRNAQRLLKPLAVINPYADQLTFLSDKTRTRRDHEKYLTLIDTIALLYQYQRTPKKLGELEYIEVQLSDIELANQLAHEVLGKTLDELPPQTRKLLKEIQLWVQQSCKVDGIAQKDFRFSRKQIRDQIQWSDNQLKIHCKRLEEMEYLLVHRGSRGQLLEYELLYNGTLNDDEAHLMGLINPDELKQRVYDKQKLGVNGKKLGQNSKKLDSSWGQVGPKLDSEKSLNLNGHAPLPDVVLQELKNVYSALV